MADNAGKGTNPPSESIQPAQEDEGDKQAEVQLLDPKEKKKKEKKDKSKKKMPSKKNASADEVAGGGDSSMFGLTLEQLKALMEVRGKDLSEKLNSSDYGGVKGVLEKLKVDGGKGLESGNEQDLEQRRTAYGRNEIPPKPMKSFLQLCWKAFHDPLVLFLLACAVISIVLSVIPVKHGEGEGHHEEDNMEWLEGIGILVAVLIIVLVASLVDWKKERQFRGLQDKVEKDHVCSVVRDNHIQQIPISDLVVGDLCFIKYGDLLPADGVLVQASDLKLDESSLTGETDLIKKNEEDDVGLLSGTQVMEGSGRMVVLGVGLNSQVGVIMGLLGATASKKKKSKDKKKDKKEKSKGKKDAPRDSKPAAEDDPKAKAKGDAAAAGAEGGEAHQLLPRNEDKKGDGDHKEEAPVATTAAASLEDAGDDEEGGSSEGKNQSVIQMKLTRLILYISYAGVAAAVLTFICLVTRFCILTYGYGVDTSKHKNGTVKSSTDGHKRDKSFKREHISDFISFVIQAITVMVVAVPEGLSLAVTLALAFAVRKMMVDNNLVRHLYACETMGNATTICSDKTGTLTTNRMTVVQSFLNGKHGEQLPKAEEINQDALPLLFEAVSVNSNYTSKIEKSKDDSGLPKQVGNKTECALLDLVLKWGGSYDDIRKNIPENRLVKVFTFNSARKMMSTIIQRDDGYRLYTKGASEMVLTKCKSILGEDNQPKDLDDQEKERLTHEVIEKMANNGLRTICIAYKDLGKEQMDWNDEEKIINDLICIGIVGIEDPVRKEVPEAIKKCQQAGVIVRMVTGDNVATARSIATKCGILKPDDDFLVLEGKEFNKRIRDESGKISQKKLDEVWPKLRVMARSSPQDKYNLVSGIVESNISDNREVVAVTGDGTNDGPALKRADVGFAMGIQGTDVAREASDIVLTDDNFSSIVRALMWGRNVYDCIAKFLQFQLTANLSAGVVSVISAAAISVVPLRALQMLWVNLVMDSLASLALATELPSDDLLKRKPYGRTKSMISPFMVRNIVGQSIYQLAVMFTILYAGHLFLDVDSTVHAIQKDPSVRRQLSEQFTMVFNAFVLMTLFNEINARKLHGERNVFKGIFRNPFFYIIWILCFAGQVLIVTFGNHVMSCARLGLIHWAWCLLFGFGSLIWQQILLCIPVDPFIKCFSAMYRVICPCFHKRTVRQRAAEEERRKSLAVDPSRRISRKSVAGGDPVEYGTIMQLTNATVVAEPPPIFARYMLRKSVDRLNTEFRVISEFRSRLEEIKDKRYEEVSETKRNSRGNILDE